MTEDEKFRIESAFYKWPIRDPYPEHTAAESLGPLRKMLNPPPRHISIHQAWREGYEFAKALVLKEMAGL